MTPQSNTDLAAVTELWADLLPFDAPDKFTLNLALRQHGLEITLYAIEQVALKRAKLDGQMTRSEALFLFGAICCSVTREKKHLAEVNASL